MTIKNLFIISLSLLFSLHLWAAENDIQQERFVGHIRVLQKALADSEGQAYPIDQVVNNLLYRGGRIAAFNLQALGKVYSAFEKDGRNYSQTFRNTVRFEFKLIEDAIGEINQHQEYLDQTSNEDKIIRHTRNKAAAAELFKFILTGKKSYLKGKVLKNHNKPNGAKVVVEKTLTHEGRKIVDSYKKVSDGNSPYRSTFWNKSWLPYNADSKLVLLNKLLLSFDWADYKTDRSYILSRLSEHLMDVATTDFEFNLLENEPDGSVGLHEYRREIRWFSMQAGVLNGLVNTDSSCPVEEYEELVYREDLIASKYTKFRKTPFPDREKVCYISKCLYYKIADVIGDLGKLKDASKYYNSENDIEDNITPKKYQKKAEKIAKNVSKNKLFETLADQLNTCANN